MGTARDEIAIGIEPASVSVHTLAQQRFTAALAGASDGAVTWSSDAGNIDSTGLFTAPSQPGSVQVTATSRADPRRSATATVTVVPVPAVVFNLTVRVEGDGQGTVAGGPIQCGTLCTAQVTAGALVALAAQPAEGSMLGGWSVQDCTGSQCAISVNGEMTIGVHFTLRPPPPPAPPATGTRRLTVSMLTMDGVPFTRSVWNDLIFEVTPAAAYSYPTPSTVSAEIPVGSKVTIRFSPYNPFYNVAFLLAGGWRGPCVANGDRCELTLDRDMAVTVLLDHRTVVHFMLGDSASRGGVSLDRPPPAADFYTYDYLRPGNELGIAILDPGESVTATAVPGPHSHLGAWSGVCTGPASAPCKIVATRNQWGGVVGLRFDPDVDPQYRLATVLPLVTAYAMKGGRVVGDPDPAGNGRGLVILDLATGTQRLLFKGNAIAAAINARGDVVGMFEGHPFVAYASGRTVVIDQVGGKPFYGVLSAIDDAGDMVGNESRPLPWVQPGPTDSWVFTFDGTSITRLDAPGFIASGINASGLIVGRDSAGHGAVYQNGRLTTTPTTPLVAVNARGVSVGTFFDGYVHNALFWDGTRHDIPGMWAPADLDEAGTVVGFTDFGGTCTQRATCGYQPRGHAAVFSGGATRDLNFLVDTSADARVAHIEIQSAFALDAEGRILVAFANRRLAVLEPLRHGAPPPGH